MRIRTVPIVRDVLHDVAAWLRDDIGDEQSNWAEGVRMFAEYISEPDNVPRLTEILGDAIERGIGHQCPHTLQRRYIAHDEVTWCIKCGASRGNTEQWALPGRQEE